MPKAIGPIDINPTAPATASASAFVKAPPEAVWALLADFEGWPSWNQNVSKMTLDGKARVGATFVWVADGARIVSRIEELDRPSRIAWTGRTLGIRATHIWEFEDKEGGTLVRTRECFVGFVAKLLRGLLRRMLEKALAQNVAALKQIVEARQ